MENSESSKSIGISSQTARTSCLKSVDKFVPSSRQRQLCSHEVDTDDLAYDQAKILYVCIHVSISLFINGTNTSWGIYQMPYTQ